MTDQLHKKFSSNQIKSLIESYTRKEIELSYILSILGIGRARFFEILKNYRQNSQTFSIEYARNCPNRKIPSEVEDDMLAELYIDKSNFTRSLSEKYLIKLRKISTFCNIF